jgi:hypothetical protein
MPDFPIDPEIRIRTSPPVVLRRTTEAVGFIRKSADDPGEMNLHVKLCARRLIPTALL